MTIQTELDQTLKELQLTNSSIADEHAQHSEAVQQMKDEIKQAKAVIHSIQSGTLPAAVETRSALAERKSAQMLDMESKRAAIMSEIEELKQKISNHMKIHESKTSCLESEIEELREKKAALLSKNAVEVKEAELELQRLKEEYAKNKSVLDQLELRFGDEKTEQKKLEQQEAARLEEEKNTEALKETKHFAALWIQLRWKSFKKRQLLKLATKGKKGKKKGGKKKK